MVGIGLAGDLGVIVDVNDERYKVEGGSINLPSQMFGNNQGDT